MRQFTSGERTKRTYSYRAEPPATNGISSEITTTSIIPGSAPRASPSQKKPRFSRRLQASSKERARHSLRSTSSSTPYLLQMPFFKR